MDYGDRETSSNFARSPNVVPMGVGFDVHRCRVKPAACTAVVCGKLGPQIPAKIRGTASLDHPPTSIFTYVMVEAVETQFRVHHFREMAGFDPFYGTSAAAPAAAAIATIIRAACFPTVGVPPVHRLPRVDATRRGRLPLNGGIYFLVHFCIVQTTGLLSSVPASSEVNRFVDRGDRSLAVESRTRVSIVQT